MKYRTYIFTHCISTYFFPLFSSSPLELFFALSSYYAHIISSLSIVVLIRITQIIRNKRPITPTSQILNEPPFALRVDVPLASQ